jgi:transposase
MRVEPHHNADELGTLIRTAPDARVARRLMAVRAVLLGQRPEDVGPQVMLSARQVRTWVARYNAGGATALEDAAGRGRKGPLTADQRSALIDRLRTGPTPADGVCALRGEDVRRILEDEFGVVRSLAAVYHLLHALGFEPLRPRPRHPKASDQEQQGFKKNSRNSWARS